MRRLTAAVVGVVAAGFALAHLDPPHSPQPVKVAADAALVMSGDVGYQRLERAVDLLRGGSVEWLVLTGAGVGGDSADTMREVAAAKGVPTERILTEGRATTTRENLLLTAPILHRHGFSAVALVTNASHMGRAERLARRAVPAIRWIPVPVADPGPRDRILRTRLQEWVKLAWYAARGWI